MGQAARKPVRVVETAGGVTIKHARIVAAVRAAGVDGDSLSTREILERAEKLKPKVVKPPTGPLRPEFPALVSGLHKHKQSTLTRVEDSATSPAGSGRGGGAHREPGSDNHVPRQQDVFLTCGDPAETLPCRCAYDRAHSFKSGAHFTPAAVMTPGMAGSGGRGVRARSDSVARRYPASLLNTRGYSIDAQEDDLHERQQRLAGIMGFAAPGADDDARRGVAVYDRFFGGREAQSVRADLRFFGLGLPGVGGGEA